MLISISKLAATQEQMNKEKGGGCTVQTGWVWLPMKSSKEVTQKQVNENKGTLYI